MSREVVRGLSLCIELTSFSSCDVLPSISVLGASYIPGFSLISTCWMPSHIPDLLVNDNALMCCLLKVNVCTGYLVHIYITS